MLEEPVSRTMVQYCSLTELADDEQDLIIEARASTQLSHSPYSNYCVGCAVRLKDGSKVHGANTENASYGLSCCAERTTIFAAHNMGRKRDICKIAITARPADVDDSYVGTTPCAPCGACRQVIKESEDLAGAPIVILMDCCDDKRIARMVGISGLLPFAFGPADLGIAL